MVRPLADPIKTTGHLQVMRQLAPGGCVGKVTGEEGTVFRDRWVYDCEEDMLDGIERGEIVKGDVIVIRYEGPKGGPGMPELLTPAVPSPGRVSSKTWP